MKLVRENINFKRGASVAKSLGIGQVIENRNRLKRQKNFIAANPEVNFSYTSSSHMIAPGKHPIWQILSFDIKKDFLYDNLRDGEIKYKKWFDDYTDFDIVEVTSRQRKYHPWSDMSNPEITDQNFQITMRNEEDIS